MKGIAFYGKSGFDYASKFGIRYHGLPEGEDASFFLCKELKEGYLDGITGVAGTVVLEGGTVEQTNRLHGEVHLKLLVKLFSKSFRSSKGA